MDVPSDQLVTLPDAAKRLGVSDAYLRAQRLKGRGFPDPAWEVGGRKLYDMRAVQAWADARPGRSGPRKRD